MALFWSEIPRALQHQPSITSLNTPIIVLVAMFKYRVPFEPKHCSLQDVSLQGILFRTFAHVFKANRKQAAVFVRKAFNFQYGTNILLSVESIWLAVRGAHNANSVQWGSSPPNAPSHSSASIPLQCCSRSRLRFFVLFQLFPQSENNIMTADFLIEQNNRTLAFLKAQDFTSAVESSAFAVKYHKALYSSASQNPLCYSSGDDCLDQCMLLSEMKSSNSYEASTHQTSFIYDLGIFVPKSVTDPSIVTSILIFNMALAHHLAAEATGHCVLQAWQKARLLYKLAYDSCETDCNVLFQFVLINNIAMIDRKIGNTKMSSECMEYLLSLWMLLVDHGCTLRLQHVHGFLVNIPFPSETAAAAWRIDWTLKMLTRTTVHGYK